MAFLEGRELEVVRWLQRLGCKLIAADEEEGDWSLTGLTGVTVGLSRKNMCPVTATVAIGMLMAGLEWAMLYGDALEVSKKARRRRKRP